MRVLRPLLAIFALLAAISTIASAQTTQVAPSGTTTQPKKKKPKKKKPKKPRPQPVAADDDDDDEDAGPLDPPDRSPTAPVPPPPAGSVRTVAPPISTTLKETDSSTSSSPNPWSNSGLVKKKDGSTDSSSSGSTSSSSSHDDASRKGILDAGPPPKPIAVAVLLGYASADLRIGFGVRGGYTLSNRVYLGGTFIYHLGTNFGTTTVNVFYPGVEGGYDFLVYPNVTVRPYLGLALAVAHSSDSATLAGTTSPFFSVYPGVQLDYQLPHSMIFVGADLRALVIVGDTGQGVSIGFFALGGVRF